MPELATMGISIITIRIRALAVTDTINNKDGYISKIFNNVKLFTVKAFRAS